MKSLHLPWLLLIALLLASLLSAQLLTRRCDDWTAQIHRIDRCVAADDWPGAEQKLDTLQDEWQGAQLYLSVVSHHRELDEAAALLRRCAALTEERDRESLRSALADLTDQLGYLAAAEQCSWRNIL